MLSRFFRRRKPSAAAEVAASVAAVTYAPELDGDPDPGEVVWAWVPYEDDPTQGKDRPAVVIGKTASQVMIVPLTTKPHPERDDEIEVGTGAWDREQRVSYAKVDDAQLVPLASVRREGAILEHDRFDRVVAAVGDWRRRHPGAP